MNKPLDPEAIAAYVCQPLVDGNKKLRAIICGDCLNEWPECICPKERSEYVEPELRGRV